MSLQLSSVQSNFLRVHLQANPADAKVLQELLSPWNLCFTDRDQAQVCIVYRQKPSEAQTSVIIPSNSGSFNSWAKAEKLKLEQKTGKLVSVQATEQTMLTVTCGTWYCFNEPLKDEQEEFVDLELENDCAVLKMDIVNEYRTLLDQTLHAKQSMFHRNYWVCRLVGLALEVRKLLCVHMMALKFGACQNYRLMR
jgi:hypothetical protein